MMMKMRTSSSSSSALLPLPLLLLPLLLLVANVAAPYRLVDGIAIADCDGYTPCTYEWQQLGNTIVGEQAVEFFGASVALSNDGRTMAVGAPYSTNSNNDTFAGATRVYTIVNGTDQWVQLGDTIEGEQAYEISGWSVALSEDGHTVAAGATGYTSSNGDSQSGAARMYALI